MSDRAGCGLRRFFQPLRCRPVIMGCCAGHAGYMDGAFYFLRQEIASPKSGCKQRRPCSADGISAKLFFLIGKK